MKAKPRPQDIELAKRFAREDVELEINPRINEIAVFTNDWVNVYSVKLTGRKARLVLLYQERCYR